MIETQREIVAWYQGQTFGRFGRSTHENPYLPGTAEHNRWQTGYVAARRESMQIREERAA